MALVDRIRTIKERLLIIGDWVTRLGGIDYKWPATGGDIGQVLKRVGSTNNELGWGTVEGGAHNQQHAITSTADHTSSATAGKVLKADSNGLPVAATNTDTEVAAAVSHASGTGSPHTPAGIGAEAAGSVATHNGATGPHSTATSIGGKPIPSGGIADAGDLSTHTGLTTTAHGGIALAVGCAKISVGTSTPGSPATGDLWIDTN